MYLPAPLCLALKAATGGAIGKATAPRLLVVSTPAPAASSCEAEYIGLFEAARDTVWLLGLLCELGYCPGLKPTKVYQDNQGSIIWGQGGLRNVRQIQLKYNYSQYLIKNMEIELEYIPSTENPADGLTKPLTGTRLSFMLQRLIIKEYQSARKC